MAARNYFGFGRLLWYNGMIFMEHFAITGGRPWQGSIQVSGAKNVAMKVILAGLLTDEPLKIHNIPHISSVDGTAEIVRHLGVETTFRPHQSLIVHNNGIASHTVPLELGGQYRTATMVIGPLLARLGKAVVPNPGGCRLGKRPIDRHIEGLQAMGAVVSYQDGYFHAHADHLHGAHYRFPSNSHTGTEALLLAAVLAKGQTVLKNAAEELEVDDLIALLVKMGARIERRENRTIVIDGVAKLHGAEHTIMPDRNEAVTFAVGAIASGGDVTVEGAIPAHLHAFLEKLDEVGGGWQQVSETAIRFYRKGSLRAARVVTRPHPGFMTDWQGPWTLLMTQAEGVSRIHETIYENRFCYVSELCKMGARIKFYHPHVAHPERFYNFQWTQMAGSYQGIKIQGPVALHNAVLEVSDLRAGATLVLAATIAQGESYIRGVDHIDRGYQLIEDRLQSVGVTIRRVKGAI